MVRRKPVLGPARGRYCGLTLAEWRGSIRTLLVSGWWVWGASTQDREPAGELHYAVIQAAALLLPVAWHKEHAGRFTAEWYRSRRGAVNARAAFFHPRTNQGGRDDTLAV